MRRITLPLLLVLSLFLVQCSTTKNATAQVAESAHIVKATKIENTTQVTKVPEVKNVILMIGDGMGVSQVYSGITANNGLNLEKAKYVGFSKTYSANRYVTDSAAGGTALATGVKTNNGAIGVDADEKAVKSILEHAADNGLATGIVASCAITHATPASFVAHQPSRNMQEEIAADLVNSNITLFIGGGRDFFNKRKDKRNLLEELKQKDFQIALDMEEVNNVNEGKLAGLVSEGHQPGYKERGDFLPESTKKALELLGNHPEGFFLMVEASQIDWAGHANDTEFVVNEMVDFDHAIKIAFDYADSNPGTLVIVTADHETGGMSLIGGDMAKGDVKAEWGTTGHTSVMVPVFAYGTAAEEFAGIYENTDIFKKIMKLYSFEK